MYVRRWWDITASIFLIHSPSCSLVRTSTKKCAEGAIDLLVCKADYRVDVNEKARQQIGIAKYKEYVKEMASGTSHHVPLLVLEREAT